MAHASDARAGRRVQRRTDPTERRRTGPSCARRSACSRRVTTSCACSRRSRLRCGGWRRSSLTTSGRVSCSARSRARSARCSAPTSPEVLATRTTRPSRPWPPRPRRVSTRRFPVAGTESGDPATIMRPRARPRAWTTGRAFQGRWRRLSATSSGCAGRSVARSWSRAGCGAPWPSTRSRASRCRRIPSRVLRSSRYPRHRIADAESRGRADRLAEEQAALRRSRDIGRGEASQAQVFTEIAEAIGQLLRTDGSGVLRYQGDRSVVVVASSGTGDVFPLAPARSWKAAPPPKCSSSGARHGLTMARLAARSRRPPARLGSLRRRRAHPRGRPDAGRDGHRRDPRRAAAAVDEGPTRPVHRVDGDGDRECRGARGGGAARRGAGGVAPCCHAGRRRGGRPAPCSTRSPRRRSEARIRRGDAAPLRAGRRGDRRRASPSEPACTAAGTRFSHEGHSVSSMVRRTRPPARIEDYPRVGRSSADLARAAEQTRPSERRSSSTGGSGV